METVIIGGQHVGQRLSERLLDQEVTAVFLEEDAAAIERALDDGIDARETDIRDIHALANVGLDRAETVIVATDSDGTNLLIAQLLRVTFETDRIIVLVNDPRNVEPFDELAVEVVCSTRTLTTAIADVIASNQ